jgi:hypothetical protein
MRINSIPEYAVPANIPTFTIHLRPRWAIAEDSMYPCYYATQPSSLLASTLEY